MKTKREMDHVFFHLRFLGQFWGDSGSSGPFQVMRLGDVSLSLGGEGLVELGMEMGVGDDASRSCLSSSVIFFCLVGCFGFAAIVYWFRVGGLCKYTIVVISML